MYWLTVGEKAYNPQLHSLISKTFDEIFQEVKKTLIAIERPYPIPRPDSSLTEQEAERCLTKVCNSELTDTLKKLLEEGQQADDHKMIAVVTQL